MMAPDWSSPPVLSVGPDPDTPVRQRSWLRRPSSETAAGHGLACHRAESERSATAVVDGVGHRGGSVSGPGNPGWRRGRARFSGVRDDLPVLVQGRRGHPGHHVLSVTAWRSSLRTSCADLASFIRVIEAIRSIHFWHPCVGHAWPTAPWMTLRSWCARHQHGGAAPPRSHTIVLPVERWLRNRMHAAVPYD